jgi:CheY-like chemotaxis protein
MTETRLGADSKGVETDVNEIDDDLTTVLVVDDDVPIREMLVLALEMEGYQVVQVCDGLQALEAVKRYRIDLVTLDIMMPGMDGWQVADRLRADRATAHIPRVMISGVPVDQLMRACASRQASAIVSKPFDLDHVLDLVVQLIGPPASRSQLAG